MTGDPEPVPTANGLQGYWFLLNSVSSSTALASSTPTAEPILVASYGTGVINSTLNTITMNNTHPAFATGPTMGASLGLFVVTLAIATLTLGLLLVQHIQCTFVVSSKDQDLYPALTLWLARTDRSAYRTDFALLPQDPFGALGSLASQPNRIALFSFRSHIVYASHTRGKDSGSLRWDIRIAGLGPRTTWDTLIYQAHQQCGFTLHHFVVERCEGRASWKPKPTTKKPFDMILDLTIAEPSRSMFVGDIREFLCAESTSAEFGLDYSRAYAISGPSGTCKSSIVQAISSALGRAIYVWELGDNRLHEEDIEQLLALIPVGACVHVRLRWESGASEEYLSPLLALVRRLRLIHGCMIFVTTPKSEIGWKACDFALSLAAVPTPHQLRNLIERAYSSIERTVETKATLAELAQVANMQLKKGTHDLTKLRRVLLRHMRRPEMAVWELKNSEASVF